MGGVIFASISLIHSTAFATGVLFTMSSAILHSHTEVIAMKSLTPSYLLQVANWLVRQWHVLKAKKQLIVLQAVRGNMNTEEGAKLKARTM
jgi:hypothetical protein